MMDSRSRLAVLLLLQAGCHDREGVVGGTGSSDLAWLDFVSLTSRVHHTRGRLTVNQSQEKLGCRMLEDPAPWWVGGGWGQWPPSVHESGSVTAMLGIQDGQSVSLSNYRISTIISDCLYIRVVAESDRDMTMTPIVHEAICTTMSVWWIGSMHGLVDFTHILLFVV
jgi:hypothetical protein